MSFVTQGQTTDFNYNAGNNLFCLPAEIQFTPTSSGTPKGYLWDFGNGTKSNSAHPIAVYTSPGTYSVRLITVYDNTTAQKTKIVTIHPVITTSFTADRNYLCQPGNVNFNASSSGDLQNYVWDFGDSTALVTTTSNLISHNFSTYGEFNVTLQATSITGCTATFSKIIKVKTPDITGTVSSLTGCVPMTTAFSATVSNLPPNSTITNYLWDFGDETSANNNAASISHNYNQTGQYSPRLTISASGGCTAVYIFDTLAYGLPPTNHIAYPFDTVLCGSEMPRFVSKATNANRYDWLFNGNNSITSVTDTLTQHKYSSLGQKNISVTPMFNGCPGTTINFSINIIGVIAKYSYSNTCSDKKTFQFNNSSEGNVSTLLWTLGNNSTSTNPDIVSHTFPQSGEFPVRLFISDNITGCVDSLIKKIYTANPSVQNSDHSICINSETHFAVSNTYTNPALTYQWNVIGLQIGPDVTPDTTLTATVLGNFTNNNVILDNGIQYCPDTLILDHALTVRGPQLDFDVPHNMCINTPLSIINLSHPFQLSDTINVWKWNFGLPAANDDNYQPSPYSYFAPGSYFVKLTAIDIYGCQDTLAKKVIVRPAPFLWIIPRNVTLCEGQSSTLIGYTSDSIAWAPAIPNFCTTCDTTMVSPVQTTKFYATSTNVFGCIASDSALVQITTAFTATPLTPDTFICAGEKVQLDVAPKNKIITWSPPENISATNIYNPTVAPLKSTIYRATLTDSAGCFTSFTDIKISIKSKPVIDAGADKAYPYNTLYTLNPTFTSNVRTWLWTPGDSLSCNTCPSPSATATATKTYTLLAVSDSGCIAKDDVTIFVESSLFLPTAFTPNNDNLNDLYRPITRGIKIITRFSIFNRQGQIIYEVKNFSPGKTSIGWDGKFHGQDQDPSAYMYIAEAVSDKGQNISSKGSFLLLR